MHAVLEDFLMTLAVLSSLGALVITIRRVLRIDKR